MSEELIQSEEKPRVTVHGIIIEKGSIEFTNTRWVLKAMSIDETRYFMNGVHIDAEGNMVATDGRRMHICRNCPIQECGFFRAAVTTKAIFLIPKDDKFPAAWEKTVPKDAPQMIESICFPAPKRPGFSTEFFKLYQATGTCFNLNYVADVGSVDGGASWTVYGKDPNKAFLFKCGDLEAVVMPMHVEVSK